MQFKIFGLLSLLALGALAVSFASTLPASAQG
jgi:hypothetical protein